MNFLAASLRNYLEAQLSQDMLADRAEAERAIALLATLIAVGAVGLAAFPLWLVAGSPGGLDAVLGFAWLLSPLAIAAFVLRTGDTGTGWRAAVIALAASVVWLASPVLASATPVAAVLAAIPLTARGRGKPEVRFASATGAAAIISATAIALLSSGSPVETIATATVAMALLALVAWLVRGAPDAERAAGQTDLAASAGRDAAIASPAVDATARPINAVSDGTRETAAAIAAISMLSEQLARSQPSGLNEHHRRTLARLIRAAGEQLRVRIGAPDETQPFLDYDSPYSLRGVGDNDLAGIVSLAEAGRAQIAVRTAEGRDETLVIELPLREAARRPTDEVEGARKSA